MFKNYIKIAFRNLWRRRGLSAINITGLAVGLSATFLIVLYISFELSYDSFHSKKANIYRLIADVEVPNDVLEIDRPALAVPSHLKEDFEEIEDAVRIMGLSLAVRNGDLKFKEEDAVAVDASFFDMFDYNLLQGDKATVLKEPYSVILTPEASKRYFGSENSIGKTLKIQNEDISDLTFTVTGIMEQAPQNSRFRPELLISFSTYFNGVMPDINNMWGTYDPEAFVLLNPNVDVLELQSKFPAFLEKYTGDQMRQDKSLVTLKMEPFTDVYLHSNRNQGVSGDINSIYIFSIIALFILLIACINFVNLTTARSVERAKEVGVRKVIGAEKNQLSKQFIGESIIIVLLAFVLSVFLSGLALPAFKELIGKEISSGILSNPSYLLILFITSLLIGVLAGIYPAFVLSSFKPVNVLKGNFSTGSSGILLRKGLVIAQFTISITLIIGTIVIYNQMGHMSNQELGFNKDHVVVLETGYIPERKALQQKLNEIPEIKSTSYTSSVPGVNNNIAYSLIEDSTNEQLAVHIDAFFVDYDYMDQYGLQLLAGRPFSKAFASDSTAAMIINERAVKLLGYVSPEDALGASFSQWGKQGEIIGVVKDFHFKSLEENIKPMSMTVSEAGGDFLSVTIQSNDMAKTIAAIETEWNKVMPTNPFNYYFLDEAFDRQYRTQQRFGKIFVNFAVLAIFISCLGLLGLAAYSMLQRRREIGIRKVLGASVTTVVNLLSLEFMKLVGIAFLIAVPIAAFTMKSWLDNFAYRIDLQWWIFALAGLIASIIALGTVGFHAIKASLTNPVKNLRTE
ncbi:ABC transporter permease [Croceitalea marina]|uniref:ABC transporter permease n=1 Tax=Croceitalea marina TaxID=1775166 RepID=A0ABW5MWI7_9FLAO